MRFLAAVLAVALLFGAVDVVKVAASQGDRTTITAQAGAVDRTGDVDADADVFRAARPSARVAPPAEAGPVAGVKATSGRLVAFSLVLPLRL